MVVVILHRQIGMRMITGMLGKRGTIVQGEKIHKTDLRILGFVNLIMLVQSRQFAHFSEGPIGQEKAHKIKCKNKYGQCLLHLNAIIGKTALKVA